MNSIPTHQPLHSHRKPPTGVNRPNAQANPLGDDLQRSVRFKGNASPQSVWAHLKQGIQRLWQKVISPFQRFNAWIQKKLNPPAASTPATVATEAAAKPNAAHEPTAPTPSEGQTALAPDASSIQPVAGVANVSPASPKEPISIELTQIVTPDSTLARPITPPQTDSRAITDHHGRTVTQAESPLETSEDPDIKVAIERSEISANEEAARSLAQEELEKQQLNQAIQLSQFQQDEALAKQLTAKELDAAKAQPLAASLSEGASTSQVAQATSVANTTSPALMKELFGSDLTRIQFQQSGANTCYLLSALDNIFQHPQGQKILDLIKVKKIENGFEVNFPGQPHPITVHHDELGQYVQSKTPGVAIIEKAYLKIPGAKPPDVFDSTHNALIRMFGKDRVSQPSSEVTTLTSSAQMQPVTEEFADIWTGITLTTIGTGQAHYYSLRLNSANGMVNVVNPNVTEHIEATLNHAQLVERFGLELNRIRLGD